MAVLKQFLACILIGVKCARFCASIVKKLTHTVPFRRRIKCLVKYRSFGRVSCLFTVVYTTIMSSCER